MKHGALVALLLLAASPLSWGCRRQEPSAAGAVLALPVESDDGARELAPHAHARPHRVIWIGLDGLDWEHLDSLAATGLLPNWSRLAREGFDARLSAFDPILSPLLWTTQQTGVGPDVHGVLDFQEVDATGRLVPISTAARKVPAVWDFASHLGLKVGVVGFWATHPAERINGFFLSDRVTAGRRIPTGTAYPERLNETVAQVVRRDATTSPIDLARYLDAPDGEIRVALSGSTGPRDLTYQLARIVGETRVTQRLSRELYDRERPDFLAAYFEGTDAIGHLFARYAAPKLGCTDDAEFRRFQRVPRAYFQMIDQILGQWMRRAREDGAVLIVTSDHGFRWGQDRACETEAEEVATAALAHRREGVFVAWGGPVAARPLGLAAASAFDVAPTLLALLDLPIDQAMRGTVLPVLPRLPVRPRQDLASGVRRSTVETAPPSRLEAGEYTKKLAALGYISAHDSAASEATPAPAGMTKGAWNNLGIYLRFTAREPAGARHAWEQALWLDPNYHSPSYNIASLEKDAGRLDAATHWLLRAVAAGHPQPETTVQSWAAEFEQRRSGGGLVLLHAFQKAYPAKEEYVRQYAILLLQHHRCQEAERALVPLEEFGNAATLNTGAAVAVCLGHLSRAGTLLRHSLAINPNQPKVVTALATLDRHLVSMAGR